MVTIAGLRVYWCRVNYDFERLFHTIVASVGSSGPLTPRMLAVIAECERQIPHQDWEILRAIDYEADIDRLRHWVNATVSELPETQSPQGLWVGICNPCDIPHDIASARSDAYLSFCAQFDAVANDWAYESLVSGECMNSDALRAIYRAAYGTTGGLENSAEYPLALAYGAMIAIEALTHIPGELLTSLDGVVCGFDSGDSLLLGKFERGVFRRSVRIR